MVDYNPKRWSPQLLAVRGSIAPKIIARVGVAVLWAVGVVLMHKYWRPIEIPVTVHTLIGVALGLLLVFRTNASYERFWEGRKVWGRILNECRNLARASRSYWFKHPEIAEPIVLWTACYPFACMHSLRGAKSLGPLQSRLPEADVARVLASEHIPTAVARQISDVLATSRPTGTFPERVVIYLDGMTRGLVDQIGECERIQKTPLPFAYVVHLRRALVLYLMTLPFALVDSFGWLTVPYVLLISYILMGIDEIGVEIENPFGTDHNDLPLENICETVEKELLSLPDAK